MKYLIVFIGLILTGSCFSKSVLNIYNWADYMPSAVIKQFEKETGIRVNYTEYDSNETLYAKLKSNPRLGYDVIFPSSYYVHRMSSEKMLLPLDKKKLTYYHNLNPLLLNQAFDSANEYSVPYLWGTTGIVVNSRYLDPRTLTGWEDFWKKDFRNQLLLFDDMREVFAIALFRLGYSINETNPLHIEEAYQQLRQLWPNIKLLSSEAEQNIYIDEDAHIGMGLSGEVFNAIAENPYLVYRYPKEGFEVWIDCIAIPKNAPHYEAAIQFINFLLRPDVARDIAIATGFSTPNQAAVKVLPKAMRESYIINPSTDILKKGQFLVDLGDINAIYETYWNRLKIGD